MALYVKNVEKSGRISFMDVYEKNKLICNTCNKIIEGKELIKYTGIGGYRKLCRTCRNKKSKESARKKAEALKMYRSFYS